MSKRQDKNKEQTVQRIAKDILWLETLEVRGRDHLDFPEVSVHSIRQALEQAYEAGRQAGQKHK